jgi:hypothetical protein
MSDGTTPPRSTVVIGGWAEVVGGVQYSGRTGLVIRDCPESDEYDYCLRFDGEPGLYAFRSTDLVPSDGANFKRPVRANRPVSATPQIPIGWYEDPEDPGNQRFWNGQEWAGNAPGTGFVNPGGELTRRVVASAAVALAIAIGTTIWASNDNDSDASYRAGHREGTSWAVGVSALNPGSQLILDNCSRMAEKAGSIGYGALEPDDVDVDDFKDGCIDAAEQLVDPDP